MKFNLITVLGPTAVGKTGIAAKLAHEFNGEIISADSRQVYRGMDIGTGKDLDEYQINGKKINYHLIDIRSPEEEFNLFDFKKEFILSFDRIRSSGKLPFLVGGTGLYLSSILQNYQMKEAEFNRDRFKELSNFDEEKLKNILTELKSGLHNTTDLIEKERIIKAIIIEETKNPPVEQPVVNSLIIGIKDEREKIKQNITARLKSRLEDGMIDEAKELLESGISYEKLMFFGLEYKYLAMYLKGELNYNDMFQKLNSAIHKFAKRQMTWFRKMEREGVKINWFTNSEIDEIRKLIKENL